MRLRNVTILVVAALLHAGCTVDTDSVASWPDLSAYAREAAVRRDGTPTVAIVDSGIDVTHPALGGRVTQVWSAPDLPAARSPHGTQIAGLIAGHQHGEFRGGSLGRARLLDARVLDAAGQARPETVAQGIEWAIGSGADYIVTSFGTEHDNPALRSAVSRAVDARIVIVAATGNGFGSFDFYPASYPGVVAITGHDGRGTRMALANGKAADFAAPGKDLLAPTAGGRYEVVSGTSAAAAVATGVIAACWRADDLRGYTLEGGKAWPDATVEFPGRDVPALDCQHG